MSRLHLGSIGIAQQASLSARVGGSVSDQHLLDLKELSRPVSRQWFGIDNALNNTNGMEIFTKYQALRSLNTQDEDVKAVDALIFIFKYASGLQATYYEAASEEISTQEGRVEFAFKSPHRELRDGYGMFTLQIEINRTGVISCADKTNAEGIRTAISMLNKLGITASLDDAPNAQGFRNIKIDTTQLKLFSEGDLPSQEDLKNLQHQAAIEVYGEKSPLLDQQPLVAFKHYLEKLLIARIQQEIVDSETYKSSRFLQLREESPAACQLVDVSLEHLLGHRLNFQSQFPIDDTTEQVNIQISGMVSAFLSSYTADRDIDGEPGDDLLRNEPEIREIVQEFVNLVVDPIVSSIKQT